MVGDRDDSALLDFLSKKRQTHKFALSPRMLVGGCFPWASDYVSDAEGRDNYCSSALEAEIQSNFRAWQGQCSCSPAEREQADTREE